MLKHGRNILIGTLAIMTTAGFANNGLALDDINSGRLSVTEHCNAIEIKKRGVVQSTRCLGPGGAHLPLASQKNVQLDSVSDVNKVALEKSDSASRERDSTLTGRAMKTRVASGLKEFSVREQSPGACTIVPGVRTAAPRRICRYVGA